MENASKALVIAGAILISIILISIGIMVVNSAYGIFGSAEESMTSQEIEMFNRQFLSYTGEQKGSAIKSLMSTINASNASHDADHQVAVTGIGSSPDDIVSAVKTTTTYTVKITTDATSGIITSIDVS